MMKVATEQHIDKLITESADERKRVRRLVASGRWRDAEPTLICSSRLPRAASSAAMVTGGWRRGDRWQHHRLPASELLTEGATVRRAVAYVEINTPVSHASGPVFPDGRGPVHHQSARHC